MSRSMSNEVDSIVEQVQYKMDYLEPDEYATFLEELLGALTAELFYAQDRL